jgi:AsmA protein
MRVLKIAGAAIAAVIVVLALALVIGIPSGFLTSEIQARVERETGYRLTISGATKIGLWPRLNVTLTDVTLENPNDRDSSNRLTVGRIRADMTLASVWSGHPQITELVIVRPVLYHPLLRERTRVPNPSSRPTTSSSEPDTNALAIDRVTVTDGTLVAFNLRDRVENRIAGINADATISGDRKITITGSARASIRLNSRSRRRPLTHRWSGRTFRSNSRSTRLAPCKLRCLPRPRSGSTARSS